MKKNNDAQICNQLEALVLKYEGYLKSDDGKELDDYEQGEHNVLLSVLQDLKKILSVN